jgi:hypothetical protein
MLDLGMGKRKKDQKGERYLLAGPKAPIFFCYYGTSNAAPFRKTIFTFG